MVPDKFNMVDMGGIDLIMMQGEAVPGLYEKLMAAISNCRYQFLYNWLFDGVLIPPTYVQIEVDDGEVYLNEGVSVTSDDVIHIYSIEPPVPEPEIIPLLAEENGVYNVPAGKDGFNPVTVDVPSYTPVINSITITENGTYTAPTGVDGYSPIIVNVPSDLNVIERASVYRWVLSESSTCWGIMEKLSGSVIGQNGDYNSPDISLVGDIMTVTLHGRTQSVEVLATAAIKLKVYRTGRILGPATMTEYTMAANDQQSFTQDDVYGGIYFEAEAI